MISDPLATPLNLPQNEDGSWPGDPRFAIRVRTVYGELKEQIVEAHSLAEALTKAKEIPLTQWFEEES